MYSDSDTTRYTRNCAGNCRSRWLSFPSSRSACCTFARGSVFISSPTLASAIGRGNSDGSYAVRAMTAPPVLYCHEKALFS